jgi:anti-anti-sigma factor
MSDEIQVSIDFKGDTAIINLVGDVNTWAEDAINQAYKEVVDSGADTIIFQYRENDYINSAGIAIMVGVVTDARKSNKRLLYTGLSIHFQKIFRMVGLTQYGDLYPSVDEALLHAPSRAPHPLEKETQDSDEHIQVTVRFAGNTAVIDLGGDLTMLTKEAINQAYQTTSDKGATNIIFNFHGQDVESSGIAALIVVVDEASKRSQRVLITGLSTQLQEVFREIGITDIYPSLKEAQEAITARDDEMARLERMRTVSIMRFLGLIKE